MDIGIHLSEERLRRLALLVELGTWVSERVAEMENRPLKGENELVDHILGVAVDAGLDDIAVKKDGKAVLAEPFAEEARRVMDAFGDDEMWARLETILGERDFYRFATPEEVSVAEKSGGDLPERVHWYYEKYAREFDAHGVDRLVIDEDADLA